eukprot:SAG31_NODE_1286_length_9000_cov_2.244692_3_plen_40_part_00
MFELNLESTIDRVAVVICVCYFVYQSDQEKNRSEVACID